MKRVMIVLCLFITVFIKAQEEPSPASFFPAAVGNVWEYDTDHGFARQVINSDSVGLDGSRYLFSALETDPDYEIDTFSFVHYLPFHLNWSIFKLDADIGETWRVQTDPPGTLARVDSIYTAYLWGEERYVKEIGYYRPPYPFEDTTVTENAVYERYVLLVSGIGEYYEFDWESGPTKILLGCIINGVTYGTVNAEEESQSIPSEFVLYQNYPNPFNPTTTIEYDLAASGRVTLKIYNVLGEEVKTLVNDYQQQGDHRITFDAQSVYGGLSSGVYIYTLIAGNKTLSKKMIYAK